MELREFAERVVFGTTLEDKLFRPDVVTDLRPGPALESPASPGRPDGLRFKTGSSGGGSSGFPGLHRLDHGEERGRVLHFFANHELLATELMALVLLRFPDAPEAFRRGVLHTLYDEQEHVRLYLDRMHGCGVAFGELPVSGFFWRSVAPMRSPMDFVSGLSLTFEQANLDFSRTFGRAFAEAGDAETARLLDRIHHDEIAHVAHGLKWFRRWKDPGESDWEAFHRVLRPPLSPRRARGDEFHPEGRLAAGLDAGFIGRLEAFSRSKGRTPQVFLFNPLAEGRLASGESFVPVAHQRRLMRDLALLPQNLGGDDDVVLVPEEPSPAFLASLRHAGLPVAEPVRLCDLSPLRDRKLGGLQPWAWTPDAAAVLAPLAPQVTGSVGLPSAAELEALAPLFGKDWGAFRQCGLHAELEALAPPDTLAEAWTLPVVARGPDAVWAAVETLRGGGHHRVVVKRSLGLAGGNAVRLWEPEPTDAQRRWIGDSFADGATVVVEPWLERLADFSVQFDRVDGRLRILGHTGLVNDHRGQYLANTVGPDPARRLPAEVLRHFRGRDPGWIHAVFERIRGCLEAALDGAGHPGTCGVDAFVYRSPGGPRLRPWVELNPRFTMGRVALALRRHVAPGVPLRFRIVNPSQRRELGHADFPSLAKAWREAHPVVRTGSPVDRLTDGIVFLNDPDRAEAVVAVLEVGRAALRAMAGS